MKSLLQDHKSVKIHVGSFLTLREIFLPNSIFATLYKVTKLALHIPTLEEKQKYMPLESCDVVSQCHDVGF